jgi:hypothetical protein
VVRCVCPSAALGADTAPVPGRGRPAAEHTKSGSRPCKDAAAGERGTGVSFEYVALEMKEKGAPVEMILPRAGFRAPDGLPKDIGKVVFLNDFDWSAKDRERILAEWQNRYAK